MIINVAKLIDNSVMRCGVPTTAENPELIMRAKEAIMFTLFDLSNRGVPVFEVIPQLLGFQPHKWIYDISPDTMDIFNIVWRQMNHTVVVPTGGTDPLNLQDNDFYTYASTQDFFLLTNPTGPNLIDYFGFCPYGNQTASFVIETANQLPSNSQWQPVDEPFVGNWRGFAYGNNTFVGIAYGNAMCIYSLDQGRTWQEAMMGTALNWSCITWSGSLFVVFASGSSTFASSPDGINWTLSTVASSHNYSAITTSPDTGVVVCVATNTTVAMRSIDGGNTFSAVTMPISTNWSTIGSGDGRFVALSANTNIVARSLDGITWVQTTMPTALYFSDIVYFNNKFYAFAGANNDLYFSSSDGISWTELTLPLPGNWQSAATGNGLISIVQTNNDISLSSFDGLNWSITALPVEANWYANGFGGGAFVAGANGSELASINTESFVQWQILQTYTDYVMPDGEWTWVDIETPAQSVAVRLRLTAPNTLSLRGFYDGNRLAAYEQPIAKMNRDDFFSFPVKGISGPPLNYYFLKDTNPQLQLWQTADNLNCSKWLLSMYVMRMPEIDLSLPLDLPIPEWYLDCIIWSVASKIMYQIPGIELARMQMIQEESRRSMSQTEASNSDTSPINLLGNAIAPYTSRHR